MTDIPLYKGHTKMNEMPDMANAGLWYDKFCNQWTSWESGVGDNKKDWIDTVIKKPIGNTAEIQGFIQRRRFLVQNNSGVNLLFRTDSRFITGMGKNHPIENGFTWHHTLGTPCIPGTSVKGVVRAYARLLTENEKISEDDIDRIFGPDDRKKDSSVGTVIFLDAIPVKPVELAADVMTPHYGPYYSDKKTPGDWHNPIPIPFLVVDDHQEFMFGLIPRNKGAEKDVETVKAWLVNALEESGAGAKTNVGYGRLLQTVERTPGDLWLEGCGNNINDIRQIGQIVKNWEQQDEHLKGEIARTIKTRVSEQNWSSPPGRAIKKAINRLKEYLGE